MELPEKLKRPMITKAFGYAQKIHAGQKRDDGEDYIIHPYRVCISLNEEFGVKDEEVLAAALLHDVIEDSDVSYSQLSDMFNERIADMVDHVTKRKDPDDPSWKKRYYDALRAADRYTQLIKFADRLDNVRDLLRCPSEEKRVRYLKETREVFLPWAKAFDEKVYRLLKRELEKAEESS